MRTAFGRLLSALAFAVAAHGAQASITCTISSPGFSAAYVPTSPGTNVTQTQFTVTCNRTQVTDASSVTYTVAADNGVNQQGTHNRGKSGSSLISYDVFRDGACGAQWRSGGQSITDSMSLPAVGFFSKSTTYWGCIPASQTGLPAADLHRHGDDDAHRRRDQYQHFSGVDHDVHNMQHQRRTQCHRFQLRRVWVRGDTEQHLRDNLHERASLHDGAQRHQRHAVQLELHAGAERRQQHRHRRAAELFHQRSDGRRASGYLRLGKLHVDRR